MSNLTRYSGDTLSRTRRWVDYPEDERKRRAAEAARDRDVETLSDLMESHTLLHGKAGARISPNTQRAYRQSVRALLAGWTHINLLHPSRDAAAILVRQWEDSGKSAATVTVRLAGARALYRALRWAGATTADPFQDVRPAPDPTPAHERRSPYSDSDVSRLLAVAEGEDRLLILLTAHGGLRISEALALTAEDIYLVDRQLVVKHGKGGRRRSVQLSRSLAEELARQPLTSGRLFSYEASSTARDRIRALCLRTGVQYRAVHAFRHTMGTRIYAETGKLELAQRALGHANISTTQLYAHFSDKRVRDAVGDW